MSFERPITIKEALNSIEKREYLLPAIQREFVWNQEQIALLFDSLMKGFPIGSFLFWKVEGENCNKFQFYEFIRNYNQKNHTRNQPACTSGKSSLTAILDGQQRLTALYIGLKGSLAFKQPRMRWDRDASFPERKLFLNLFKGASGEEQVFDFRFLTKEEAAERSEDVWWFRVGDILDMETDLDYVNYLGHDEIRKSDNYRVAAMTLSRLYTAINKEDPINYYLEKGEELDKVLKIFVRTNSGGTKLSHSDLLLSIATAQWKELDARKEITEFVDSLNNTGRGFDFNKDLILKSCLVMNSEIGDITFKVDNFNAKNMRVIEKNWKQSAESIRQAALCSNSFGYYRETISSYLAIIPMAHYIERQGSPSSYWISSKFADDRRLMKKWMVLAQTKKLFSGTPDAVLRPIRTIMQEDHSTFPLDQIIKEFRGKPKNLDFSDNEIENLLDLEYGDPDTFSILALLYPNLDYRNDFHIDHIHPRSDFTMKKLEKVGIVGETAENYIGWSDCIGNLQLLEGIFNIEKSSKPFSVWVEKEYKDEEPRRSYVEKNYIPNVDWSLANFEKFAGNRNILLRNALTKVLEQ